MFKSVAASDQFEPGAEDRSPPAAERKAATAPRNNIALFGFRDLETAGDALKPAGQAEKKHL